MSADSVNHAQAFADAALQHWHQLGEELRADVNQASEAGQTVSFSRPGETEYRVSNSNSGLEVRIVADPEDHIVRYDFHRTNGTSAGVPEGGILSMRLGRNGVEFYSSDQPLTAKEARNLLLDPVLTVSHP